MKNIFKKFKKTILIVLAAVLLVFAVLYFGIIRNNQPINQPVGKLSNGYGFLDPYYASGLVDYWSFNGADINNSTDSAYDRSSSYATGTMINMATSTRAVRKC